VHTACARKIHRQSSLVVAKLTYAAKAWWGFATAADRQRVEAVIRRGVRSGLGRSDILTATELIEDLDDNLFQRISWDKNHILHALLPDRRRSLEYELNLAVMIENWYLKSTP